MAAIKATICYIYLFLVVLHVACSGGKQIMAEVYVTNIIEINTVIKEARIEIDKLLRKNKISPLNKEFVYLIYGTTYEKYTPCSSINPKVSLIDFLESISFGKNWVRAMVLDDKYIAKVGTDYISFNPEVFSSYLFEMKLIEFAYKNDYLAFIMLFNCPSEFIYGVKKNQIDVLHYRNDNMEFKKSISYP